MTDLFSADDITSILKAKIDGYTPSMTSEQVGRVTESGDGIARVSGLPAAMANELLDFGVDSQGRQLLGIALNLGQQGHALETNDLRRAQLAAQGRQFFPGTRKEFAIDRGPGTQAGQTDLTGHRTPLDVLFEPVFKRGFKTHEILGQTKTTVEIAIVNCSQLHRQPVVAALK